MIERVQIETMQRLGAVYQEMKEQGDEINSLKFLDLIQKAHQQEFTIAFCGHFSAGKSSMLNELYGENLLPTSPIPTSANVVKIQHGEDRVTLLLSNGESHTYKGAYTDQELKQLCKNGEEIIAVHIYRKSIVLPEGVNLLDTPGIDSTDEAHRIATESALHLADIIFYMMDYNHVQSEVNLQFVKELKQRQKPVYLIINQIDKHREAELSFHQYQRSVEQSFQNWEIYVDGIYYTSLRDLTHPMNELSSLKQAISQMMAKRDDLIQASLEHEAEFLIQEHLRWKEEQHQATKQQLQEQIRQFPQVDWEKIDQSLQALVQEQVKWEQQPQKTQTIFYQGIESILQNAYLMPFEVRELAHHFLETVKTDFKVGFLFTKAKTEKEKEQRLYTFFEKLKQTVDTQIDFHLKQYLVQFLKENEIYTEQLGSEIYQASITLKPDLLKQVVKTGAGLTGNYVLTYTEDLAHEIKKMYRQLAVSLYERFLERFQEHVNDQIQQIKQKISQLEQMQQVSEQLNKLQKQHEEYDQFLHQLLHGEIEPSSMQQMSLNLLLQNREKLRSSKPFISSLAKPKQEDETSSMPAPFSRTEMRVTESNRDRIMQLVQAAETLMSDIVGLQSVQKELLEKRRRVEKKQFTVALFGAFSAGKSSFANALIGENVLPVSPNPTTATINQICPPDEERVHGEVVVRLKSKELLFQDLKAVYKIFGRDVETMEEALQGIEQLCSIPSPTARQKTTFPFLRAVQQGYTSFEAQLGTELILNQDEWQPYVANEEKSSFVEYAKLYYDCPLTRQGVTIVDTPGADSIHARHTDVAFQYIKNADAILFVTYYNHAFSRADREFLIQLGRVKDAFSLDKMFFIMNAADLATSEEELHTVQQYIKEQLLQYGIRYPRLFAVSSLLALEEKRRIDVRRFQTKSVLSESGISAFEKEFTSFMMKDLMMVSLHSMKSDMKRAYLLLEQMIETNQRGNAEKQAKIEQNEQEKEQMIQTIDGVQASTEEQALEQEIQELLYYVNQRLFLRYHDVFTEIFNPSALREDEGDVKQKLRACVMEMVHFIQYDLMQEMRAISLRIEKWMNQRLRGQATSIASLCNKINGEVAFSMEWDEHVQTPNYKEPFPDLNISSFKKALATFRNAKSFFEKNEKKNMQEEMKKTLEPLVSGYVDKQRDIFVDHYRMEWRRALEQLKEKAKQDCTHYYESIYFALSETVDVKLFTKIAVQMKKYVEEMELELNRL